MSRGWIILCHFCRCGCGCGVRGDLELPHRLVLVDLECSGDATSYFSLVALSVNSRDELACAACGFTLSLRPRDTIGELSRGSRGVVFVFDLLLNFKFVFSHLNTFRHHPLGQRPSLGLRLRIRLWMRRRCVLTFHFFI